MCALQNKIVIIGGKLQGTEACYLGRKAGIKTVLVDKNPNAPARHLCDTFICEDLFDRSDRLLLEMTEADMVLPALENDNVLSWLYQDAKEQGYTLGFDWEAYQVSSSKIKSDRLFRELQIPVPEYYPGGDYPYICKPDSDSGSHGVARLRTPAELESALAGGGDLVIQEFLEGPSYSVEIIGKPGMYRTYEITQIHMDEAYDCNKVTAPCPLTTQQDKALREMAVCIAEALGLHGIMDLEVIDHHGTLKLLEIDARIPSQTPTAVLKSSGMNLLLELRDLYVSGTFMTKEQRLLRHAAYEHVLFDRDDASPLGERIMTGGEGLRLLTGFFGADEAVTDYREGLHPWRATLINSAPTAEELAAKRSKMFAELNKR